MGENGTIVNSRQGVSSRRPFLDLWQNVPSPKPLHPTPRERLGPDGPGTDNVANWAAYSGDGVKSRIVFPRAKTDHPALTTLKMIITGRPPVGPLREAPL